MANSAIAIESLSDFYLFRRGTSDTEVDCEVEEEPYPIREEKDSFASLTGSKEILESFSRVLNETSCLDSSIRGTDEDGLPA